MSGLAAGMAIGIVGDAGVRAVGQQEKLFVGMILILIFAEALGLYGLIVALILSRIRPNFKVDMYSEITKVKQLFKTYLFTIKKGYIIDTNFKGIK